MFELSLKDILSVIDEYQNIIIKFKGDNLYIGKRMNLQPCELYSDIHVLNILTTLWYDEIDIYLMICIDKSFD